MILVLKNLFLKAHNPCDQQDLGTTYLTAKYEQETWSFFPYSTF